MRISETFLSLQGESRTTGAPTFFVRTSGCNLRCVWCDTRHSFYGGREVPVSALIADATASGARHACLTGGEPLLQPDAADLCAGLQERGLAVQVETGGHMDLAPLPAGVRIVADLKTPGSGEAETFHLPNLRRLTAHDDLKVVVTSREDLDWAAAWLDRHDGWGPWQVLVSPVEALPDPAALASRMLEFPSRPWRMQVQLHKLLWGGRRGT